MSKFRGVAIAEGLRTGDGRYIEPNGLSWETPIPLRYCPVDTGAHDDAIMVGVITELTRDEETGMILMSGNFLDNADGQLAREAVEAVGAHGMNHGVSADLDFADVEIIEDPEKGETLSFLSAKIRAVTMVQIPAFEAAYLAMDDSVEDDVEDAEDVVEDDDNGVAPLLSLVASAADVPVAPPLAWFQNPHLPCPTPITVTDDGHVFGHIADWFTPHASFPGKHVPAPRSRTDYAFFRTGVLRTAEGTDVYVGRISMGGGHAESGGHWTPAQVMAHYDNTSTAVADVVTGEDQFGIWFSGALRPNLTDAQIRELRASALSGDWREMNGNLELYAVLAVNSPGFALPRYRALVASGRVTALVASAGVIQAPEETGESMEQIEDGLLSVPVEEEAAPAAEPEPEVVEEPAAKETEEVPAEEASEEAPEAEGDPEVAPEEVAEEAEGEAEVEEDVAEEAAPEVEVDPEVAERMERIIAAQRRARIERVTVAQRRARIERAKSLLVGA